MNEGSTHQITLSGTDVSYSIDHSTRARYIRLHVVRGRGLVVTLPRYIPELVVRRFLIEHQSWILKHLYLLEKWKNLQSLRVSDSEFEKGKKAALEHMKERVKFFNTFYGFTYNRVSVRNQTSLWGSCTITGNLQFNYKLMKLSQHVRDYVVVHELCHLKEHNHSANFWKLVSKVFPDYKLLRKHLRGYALA